MINQPLFVVVARSDTRIVAFTPQSRSVGDRSISLQSSNRLSIIDRRKFRYLRDPVLEEIHPRETLAA